MDGRTALPSPLTQCHLKLQGRLTLLLGPPGSGKSVLLRTLAGQLSPSKTVRVGGWVGGPVLGCISFRGCGE